jgi:hypothetical protein
MNLSKKWKIERLVFLISTSEIRPLKKLQQKNFPTREVFLSYVIASTHTLAHPFPP